MLCNGVIQHIKSEIVKKVIFPGLYRVLKRDGVLQLMFKTGTGVLKVFDRDYETERVFQLYNEH